VTGCLTAPTLLGPPDGGTLDTRIPLLQWDSGNNPNATAVHLEIWRDPELTDWAYGFGSSYDTQGVHEFRLNMNLDPATTHYWRGYLTCGITQGPYSALWSFTTGSGGTILPAPELIAPANGTTLPGTTAIVEWSPVAGAVEYWVWFSGGGSDRGTPTWDTQDTLSLSPNTTYEWWVQARNDYALGTESDHWQFTTGASASSLPSDPSSPYYIYGQSEDTTTIFEEQK
jgi:hypothetical protein